MVVTYYIKLFRTVADRHNSILMSLLLLVAEAISWIIYPCGQLDDTGLVKLPKSKAEKVLQLYQDIESLLPNTKPSLDQALLSLIMHRKTEVT